MRFLSLVFPAVVTVPTFASPSGYDAGEIKWKACPPLFDGYNASRMHCGYLDVPLNWDNPHSHEPISIGFVKLSARDPNNRIGYLFYNPGGPAEPASSTLGSRVIPGPGGFHTEILDRFDIIGMDLRGSGLSEKINCNRTFLNTPFPLYPSDEESYQLLVDSSRAFRESCLQMTGRPLIDYMDTVSIAKDFEAIRQALGGEKVTYLGNSYGTLLGSQYAELFPTAFRAILLDGVVSNSQSETSQFIQAATSIDAALEKYFDWCTQQNSTLCPLSHQNKPVKTIWTDLMQRAEKAPIPAPTCVGHPALCESTKVTATQIRQGTLSALYQPFAPDGRFTVATTLAAAIYKASFNNDASSFAAPVVPDNATLYETYLFAQAAISCQDDAHVSSPSNMHLKKLMASTQTPLLLGAGVDHAVFVRWCLGWPQPKRNPPHEIDIPQTPELPQILLVTNLWDPATPNPAATNLLYEIGVDRARVLTRKGLGHTVLFQHDAFHGPTLAAMNKYLLELRFPEQGAVYEN